MYQLLQGVRVLHENELTHRFGIIFTVIFIFISDLKPDNILIHKDNELKEEIIKISDFGLMRVITPDALGQTQCGTPLHMVCFLFCLYCIVFFFRLLKYLITREVERNDFLICVFV
jgi:hypothetical protein